VKLSDTVGTCVDSTQCADMMIRYQPVALRFRLYRIKLEWKRDSKLQPNAVALNGHHPRSLLAHVLVWRQKAVLQKAHSG